MLKILNLSGGKDSTALAILSKLRGIKYDYIVYADTGKDWGVITEHLNKLERYLGQKIIRLQPAKSFEYLMLDHVKTKGKNKGKRGYGWSNMLCRWCTGMLKTNTINVFCRTLGDTCVHYIGIAADEPKRVMGGGHKQGIPLIRLGDYRGAGSGDMLRCRF